VLVEPQARTSLGQDGLERGLAHSQRITPQVVTVQLDQVEGVEEDASVIAPVADAVEVRHTVLVAAHGLAVDDTRARAQAGQRLDDQREAMGEVIARTAVEPHLRASLAGNDAEAVMFDLMQSLAAGRQLRGFGWKARRDEPGRRVRCNIVPIAKGYSRASQSFLFAHLMPVIQKIALLLWSDQAHNSNKRPLAALMPTAGT
jgi:hypothetical protein